MGGCGHGRKEWGRAARMIGRGHGERSRAKTEGNAGYGRGMGGRAERKARGSGQAWRAGSQHAGRSRRIGGRRGRGGRKSRREGRGLDARRRGGNTGFGGTGRRSTRARGAVELDRSEGHAVSRGGTNVRMGLVRGAERSAGGNQSGGEGEAVEVAGGGSKGQRKSPEQRHLLSLPQRAVLLVPRRETCTTRFIFVEPILATPIEAFQLDVPLLRRVVAKGVLSKINKRNIRYHFEKHIDSHCFARDSRKKKVNPNRTDSRYTD